MDRNKLILEWKELYIDINECHRILEYPTENIDTDMMREWINNMCDIKNQIDEMYNKTFKYLLDNRRI